VNGGSWMGRERGIEGKSPSFYLERNSREQQRGRAEPRPSYAAAPKGLSHCCLKAEGDMGPDEQASIVLPRSKKRGLGSFTPSRRS
jgi:hypothetical protein